MDKNKMQEGILFDTEKDYMAKKESWLGIFNTAPDFADALINLYDHQFQKSLELMSAILTLINTAKALNEK